MPDKATELSEKNKGGRPSITLSKKQKDVLPTLASKLTAEQIADSFNISRRSFFNLLERDEEVFALYKKGKADGIDRVANSLIDMAESGNASAAIFYLKTQAGWKETTAVEHTSPDGSMTPTAIEWVVVDEQATDRDS